MARLREEHDIPEARLRALAAPIDSADCTWYLAAESEGRWLLATIYPLRHTRLPGRSHWGLCLRGKPDSDLAFALAGGLYSKARECAVGAILSEPVPSPGPVDDCLRRAGFKPFVHLNQSSVPTHCLGQAFPQALSMQDLLREGFSVLGLSAVALEEVTRLFDEADTAMPNHVLHIRDAEGNPSTWDSSRVLCFRNEPVAVIVSRRHHHTTEVLSLVCRRAWRGHPALDTMLLTWAQEIARQTRHCHFFYATEQGLLEELSGRVGAKFIMQEVAHWRSV